MAHKSKLELNTETAVELLVSMRDNDNKNFDKVAASIDTLAVNIAQLTTQQKATATNLDKLGDRLDKMTDRLDQMIGAINGHLAVAQSQSANIAELTKLATAIVSRSAQS